MTKPEASFNSPEIRATQSKAAKKLKSSLEIIGHFVVIIGIIFAFFEYSSHQSELRLQKSVEYMKDFYREDVTDAKLRLQSYWIDKPIKSINQLPGSAGVIDQLARNFIFPDQKKPNVNDLLRVIEQIDIISTCANTGICEERIIIEQLGGFITNFHKFYQEPICKLKTDFLMEDLGDQSFALVHGSPLVC